MWMYRSSRTAHLDEDVQVLQVAAVPGVEGLQQLQTVALGVHFHAQGDPVGGRVLVGVLSRVKVTRGKLVPRRRLQFELLPVGGGEVICLRVEFQGAGDGEGCDNLQQEEQSAVTEVALHRVRRWTTELVLMCMEFHQDYRAGAYVYGIPSGLQSWYLCVWNSIRTTELVLMCMEFHQDYRAGAYVYGIPSGLQSWCLCVWNSIRTTGMVLMCMEFHQDDRAGVHVYKILPGLQSWCLSVWNSVRTTELVFVCMELSECQPWPSGYLWRGDEGVGCWVGIVPGGEVSVERRDDCVLLSLLDVAPE